MLQAQLVLQVLLVHKALKGTLAQQVLLARKVLQERLVQQAPLQNMVGLAIVFALRTLMEHGEAM